VDELDSTVAIVVAMAQGLAAKMVMSSEVVVVKVEHLEVVSLVAIVVYVAGILATPQMMGSGVEMALGLATIVALVPE
jgi:hypothetical protein